MWIYFADMLGRMVQCFWKAFRTINGCIGMGVLILSLVGSTLAASLKDLSPTFPFAAVVVLFGYLFVKASHEKDQERVAALKAEHEASDRKSLETEKLRATNEANADRVSQLRQQILAYADSAPLGASFTMSNANAWTNGALRLLDASLGNRGGFEYDAFPQGFIEAEESLYLSVASLRAIAAGLTFNHLR